MAMQCHYEVLSVPRDADEDQIKKSYRKLALKYHPDKNPDNLEESTEKFRLVQSAYDVLMDPQERAWYDKHREAFLKGGLGQSGEYQDECVNVFMYCKVTCYSGFGDDAKGFYTVYRGVFEKIAAEDAEYMDDDDDEPHPAFGDSQSVYEEIVGPFYGFWEGYYTRRSYVWVEKYDTREGDNRRVRRLMEADNKKERDKAKQERNEEVRGLVAYVKKRDPRVAAYKVKLAERAKEVKRLAEEKKKSKRRERLKSLEGYKEADWMAHSALDKDLASLEAGYAKEFGETYESSSDEEEVEEGEEIEDKEFDCMAMEGLFCFVCNKPFKTAKSLSSHQNSKKHAEKLAAVIEEMKEDDKKFSGSSSGTNGSAADEDEDNKHLEQDLDNMMLEDDSEEDKKDSKVESHVAAAESEGAAEVNRCEPCDKTFNSPEALSAHSKTKKHKRTEADFLKAKKSQAKQKEQNLKAQKDLKPATPKTDTVKAPAVAVAVEGGNVAAEDKANGVAAEDNADGVANTEEASPAEPPQDKPQNTTKKQKASQEGGSGEGTQWPCNKCTKVFPSRNKLFDHIKKTGHALRVDNTAPVEVDDGKKGKKKKKGKK